MYLINVLLFDVVVGWARQHLDDPGESGRLAYDLIELSRAHTRELILGLQEILR